MKKTLILLLAISISTFCGAQVKKKGASKPSEIQIIKKDAINWFKQIYVESNFKDPYSYKLLKSEIYPVNNREFLESEIRQFDNIIYSSDTTKSYFSYQTKLKSYKNAINDHHRKFKDQDTSSYRYKYSLKNLDRERLEVEEAKNRYTGAINNKKEAEELLMKSSESLLSSVSRYRIYLDCYSNNSYGNPVLGRYVFIFDKNGKATTPLQLNKEE